MALGIYKPGQGYWTRVISVCALIVIGLSGAAWFWKQLSGFVDTSQPDALMNSVWIRGIIPATFVVGALLACYWIYGTNRRSVDFFVATEGEMKKVNWSTRREIFGSTWVVIFVAVGMAVLLFVVDSGFSEFFKAIGVLQGESQILTFLKGLFSGGSGG